MRLFQSIRVKIIAIASIPVFLVTAVLAVTSYQEVVALGQEQVEQVRAQMMEDRKRELKQYIDMAVSSIKHLSEGATSTDSDEVQEEAKSILRRLRYGGNGYFFVYQYDGTNIVLGPKPSLEGKNLIGLQDKKGAYLVKDLIELAQKGGGYYTYYWDKPSKNNEAVQKLSYATKIDQWNWMLGTGFYIDEVEDRIVELQTQIDADVQSTLIRVFGVAALFLVLAIVGGSLFARAITRPLKVTADALNNIAAGDGDLTQRIETGGSSEISAVSRGFNQFADKIHQTISQVSGSARQIADSSGQLLDISNSNSSDIAKQTEETQHMATAITEMAATAQEVSRSAAEAAQAATKADTEAANGAQVVSQTIEAIELLKSEVESAVSVINTLESESENIGMVLDVIRNIADQTNLLALNAAIEAARAGDQGRGFAVVADEVRTLASRTQESTQEIQQMMERLQSGSSEAVSVMKSSQEKTLVTVERAQQAGESLTTIQASVATIHSMNSQIASAAEEQGVVAEEINRNVVSIADIANHTSQGSSQSANASKELAVLGDQMSALVNQFKL